jgi:actin-related protein
MFTKLDVDPKDHPIFLVEKELAFWIKREIIVQLLFESFNVPDIQGANEAILTLAATGRIEGLAI